MKLSFQVFAIISSPTVFSTVTSAFEILGKIRQNGPAESYLSERLVTGQNVLATIGMKDTIDRIRSRNSVQLSGFFELGWRRRWWQLFLHTSGGVTRFLQFESNSQYRVNTRVTIFACTGFIASLSPTPPTYLRIDVTLGYALRSTGININWSYVPSSIWFYV